MRKREERTQASLRAASKHIFSKGGGKTQFYEDEVPDASNIRASGYFMYLADRAIRNKEWPKVTTHSARPTPCSFPMLGFRASEEVLVW